MSSSVNKAKQTAVCGMATALSVVLMLVAGVVTVMMYVIPVITGLIVYVIMQLYGKKWALGVFFATTILSFLLIADKEAALAYTFFFGYYPLIKEHLKKTPKAVSIILKFIIFNIAAVAVGVTGVYLFGFSAEEYSEFGKFTIPILLALANVMFVMYDIMLTRYKALILGFVKKLAVITGGRKK